MEYILRSETIRTIEADAFAKGLDSFALMHKAAEAVCKVIRQDFDGRKVAVIAGPGKNGGDGLVIASMLRHQGIDVKVYVLDSSQMSGDAKKALQLIGEDNIEPLQAMDLAGSPVLVDALFGIGLARPLSAEIIQIIDRINQAKLDVVSVDLPSGIEANSANVLGAAIKATVTVTFIAKKYAHVMLPGREYCGRVVTDSLGIKVGSYEYSSAYENLPSLWGHQLKWPTPLMNKYDRGHTLVIGGAAYKAGASKLAALAALRSGAGLVTIICAQQDVPIYASAALSLMTASENMWQDYLNDDRVKSIVIGPGAGVEESTRLRSIDALSANKRVLLDADGITSFAGEPQRLFSVTRSRCVLTPHSGEFARLFPDLAGLPRQDAALKAAERSHCIVVLKGYDTVIASPDGRRAINTNAPPTLSTAGSGDVLSGICGGFMAQGMDLFEAACAAVWLHAEAAMVQGQGLIAEDLLSTLPLALHNLQNYART